MRINRANRLKPLKWYKSLSTKKGRQDSGCFIVEGVRSIQQVLGQCPQALVEMIVVNGKPLFEVSCPLRIVTEAQFKSISASQTPQGIAAVVYLPIDWNNQTLPQKLGEKILMLEHIQDPGNVGTLIRTAVAFGFSGIILSDQCADPFSPKCVQASTGTILSAWIRRTPSYLQMAETLKLMKYELIVMDMKGSINIGDCTPQGNFVLALGNEGSGVSDALQSMSIQKVRIPIDESKAESLNVAVCGGIGMHYLSSNT